MNYLHKSLSWKMIHITKSNSQTRTNSLEVLITLDSFLRKLRKTQLVIHIIVSIQEVWESFLVVCLILLTGFSHPWVLGCMSDTWVRSKSSLLLKEFLGLSVFVTRQLALLSPRLEVSNEREMYKVLIELACITTTLNNFGRNQNTNNKKKT